MMSLSKYINQVKQKPAELFVGLCVVSVAIMGTSVNHVASTAYSLLLLFGLINMHHAKAAWFQLAREEKLLLLGYALYLVSGLLSGLNVEDTREYFKDLERYLRFFLAIPIYLALRYHRIDVVKYLYAGAILSGPFLMYIAVDSYIQNPGKPASGYYHHIIFGSLAMFNIGVMLALLLTREMQTKYRVLVLASISCALTAAILSQSRGVWLVLPVYLLIVTYLAVRHSISRMMVVFAVLAFSVIVISLTPAKNVINQRIDVAVQEVTNFYEHGKYASSVGQRLAMWEISFNEWKRYPVLGIGPGDFDNVVIELQKQGKYVGMEVHSSTHNIYMQALACTGLFGLFITIYSLIFTPLMILMRSRDPGLKYTGTILIIAFAVIGISESWTLRLSIISVYIIYTVALISASSIDRDNKANVFI